MKGEACSRRLMSPYSADAMLASGVRPEQDSRPQSSASLAGRGCGGRAGGHSERRWARAGRCDADRMAARRASGSRRASSGASGSQRSSPADLAGRHQAARAAQHLHRCRLEDAASTAAAAVALRSAAGGRLHVLRSMSGVAYRAASDRPRTLHHCITPWARERRAGAAANTANTAVAPQPQCDCLAWRSPAPASRPIAGLPARSGLPASPRLAGPAGVPRHRRCRALDRCGCALVGARRCQGGVGMTSQGADEAQA